MPSLVQKNLILREGACQDSKFIKLDAFTFACLQLHRRHWAMCSTSQIRSQEQMSMLFQMSSIHPLRSGQ